MRDPRELVAWQLCSELDELVFAITATGAVWKDFEFRDQIRSAAGAPAPQIAEGFGRFTPREFANYLRMAVGSLMETQTHLGRGLAKGYFTAKAHSDAATLCGRALRMTQRLLASKLRQIQQAEEAKRQKRRPAVPRDPPPTTKKHPPA